MDVDTLGLLLIDQSVCIELHPLYRTSAHHVSALHVLRWALDVCKT